MAANGSTRAAIQRRLPIGAEMLPDGGVHFRVWAPRRRRVVVVLEHPAAAAPTQFPLETEPGGYFSATAPDATAETRYHYRLDDGRPRPDPASRFQPDGPHGPSQIVDPARFAWTDRSWRGVAREEAVVYEMHVGTFTPEGTWNAAARQLPALVDTGITVIELMPVADFPGRFGWGYDGVDLFAPTRLYGTPDEMRAFIDRAHAAGIAVILDVVYNHFGPDGNYLSDFADAYVSTRHHTEWGDAPNFDGDDSGPVREFFLANVGYWISEYHLDGLRIDATQSIFDDSAHHILGEMADMARKAGGERRLLLIAENEPQDVRTLQPRRHGGHALDAAWNDDFHHTAIVALTGRDEAYYSDYGGSPQELISAARHSYLFQGQHYAWQEKRRGTSTRGVPASAFVHYIQNHDQIANSADGRRIHELTSPGRLRAITALLLLGPQIPMLFQGQEFAASSPFLFFADHQGELAPRVRKGRAEFLAQFPGIAGTELANQLPPPEDPRTFERCRLDHDERRQRQHAEAHVLHRDLLRLRREDPVLRRRAAEGLDGAVLGDEALVLRFHSAHPEEGDRLLVLNLGATLRPHRVPEPLLAPPQGARWRMIWSSDAPAYGGRGAPPLPADETGWSIPAEAAMLLVPAPDTAHA